MLRRFQSCKGINGALFYQSTNVSWFIFPPVYGKRGVKYKGNKLRMANSIKPDRLAWINRAFKKGKSEPTALDVSRKV